MIYLDYMATTPVDKSVFDAMKPFLMTEGVFANPASIHPPGQTAMQAVQGATDQAAACLGVNAASLVWTSGATESINLALKGACEFYGRTRKHIITTQIAHKSELAVCEYLATQGFEVTYLSPTPEGIITPEAFEVACREDTLLASVMLVNNEVGTIQPVSALARIAKSRGILFHTDASQALGKIPIDINTLGCDLLSLSGHKAYGPKGVGLLYVRDKPVLRLAPQIHGGGHQHQLRSGTLPTHQIVGMAAAMALATAQLNEAPKAMHSLRDQFWDVIKKLPNTHLNHSFASSVPHCLNVHFEHIDAEVLMLSLNELAFSAGSACNAASFAPSHVLMAMGKTRLAASESVRFSFGRFSTLNEIAAAAAMISECVATLQAMLP